MDGWIYVVHLDDGWMDLCCPPAQLHTEAVCCHGDRGLQRVTCKTLTRLSSVQTTGDQRSRVNGLNGRILLPSPSLAPPTSPAGRAQKKKDKMETLVCTLLLVLQAVSAGPLRVDDGQDGGGVDAISHPLALVQRLEALLLQGNGSDVTLRVATPDADEVKLIPAHTLVLSLQSPVFEELLLDLNGSTLTLGENADCTAVFDKFIRYLYCGDVSLRLNQATPLHQLASKYQVAALRQGLTRYMTQNLARDSPSGHVAGWYEYAVQAGDTVLSDSCLRYLAWNLSSVMQSAEWAGLSSQLLMSLLQRSDLVLHSEMELFAALEAWIAHNRPDGLTVENALRAVRYAMMPPRELFRLQTQSAVLARYQESVRDLLYMSYQFHSASPVHMAKFFDVNCSLFVPRNYLAPLWGSSWVINNPTRDDRSTSFQTQLGPSGHDAAKRVTWNVLFSPRWLPLSMRPMYSETGAMQPTRAEGGWPRIIITPATSSADFAGVSFQKTVLVLARQQGQLLVKHVYNFHQSTEENGDFLAEADLYRRSSDYLLDGSLLLHVVVKPLYQNLIATKN
ncbi:BTB/POZ domain-containing protein 17-like [Nerophis lumbriciformis]|uniref:BTB/POZ domain-containing protein 17-like n=1 Tax=Nerophis lumbriciformis TaxID=546530 RepID=UPI002ADFCF51|nr:BTB/POZ domain-containing protein 17-like [Nerophis lumbriciformis]